MQIHFTGHGIEVTPALRELVEDKFKKIQHHFDHITSARVTLHVEKLDQKAEITIHVPGHELHASGMDKDMYKAVDSMINSLDRQVLKHKEKISKHRE